MKTFFYSTCNSFKGRNIILLLVITIACTTDTSAQYEHLLHKTYGERAPLLMTVYHQDLRGLDSVKIFRKIRDIEKLAISNSDDDLLLETKLMRAHYFYYRKRNMPNRVLAVLDSLKAEGRSKGKVWAEAMAENMTALYYYTELKKYELAFEHHLRVYQLVRNLSPNEFPYKQDCLKQIADEYYVFEDYSRSIFFNKEALNAEPPKKMNLYSFPISLSILNTIGLSYQKKNMLDSADYFFNLVLKKSKQENSMIWEGISSGNLGRNLFLKGNYQAASTLILKEVRIAEDYPDLGLAASALTVLGDISLKTGKSQLAAWQLDKAYSYIQISGEKKRLKDLYPLMSKISALKQEPEKAAMYLDSAIFVRDSLKDEMNSMKMLKAAQRIDLERYRNEVNSIESQRKINIIERNALIVFITIMTGVVVAAYRVQQKKNRWQKKKALMAGEELAAAALQLNNFAKNLAEKNELIELLEQQKDGRDTEVLVKLQQSTILTEGDWSYFRDLFEKVHRGFFLRLKEHYPDLSPAEIRFMALSKLGLSTREMASMLGVGTDTIRQHRSRIRKKLGLTEDFNLEDIASTI